MKEKTKKLYALYNISTMLWLDTKENWVNKAGVIWFDKKDVLVNKMKEINNDKVVLVPMMVVEDDIKPAQYDEVFFCIREKEGMFFEDLDLRALCIDAFNAMKWKNEASAYEYKNKLDEEWSNLDWEVVSIGTDYDVG